MSKFQVGEFAITQNTVWQGNSDVLVQVVAVNARTQAGTTATYAICRIDGQAFEASLDVNTGIPRFLAEDVIGCAEHQLRSGSYDEIMTALVSIAEKKRAAQTIPEPALQP